MISISARVANSSGPAVSRYLYSHFAEHLGRCIYPGIWVGDSQVIENEGGIRLDVVSALKKLRLPALRWPGGCFADNYHWRDGIGPRQSRPKRYNLWWLQPEKNEFGTHEFIRFCDMIGAEPYICTNVGSGTVEEARSWIEYCNSHQSTALADERAQNGSPHPFNVKFWGVGNESWGCGGSMYPEYYANLFRQFATYMKATDRSISLVACGSHPGIPEWDAIFLERMKGTEHLVDYLALHIYSAQGISDLHYSDEDYYQVLGQIQIMDSNLSRAAELCRAHSTSDHRIKVILDEWGTWFKEAQTSNGLYQQSTMLDAIFAALSFHCFHRHASDLFMTNMAQTINVLQALILTEGPNMCCTPTYHVYDLLSGHRDGKVLPVEAQIPVTTTKDGHAVPAASLSATEKDGELTLSMVNTSLDETINLSVALDCGAADQELTIRMLTADNVRAHNTPKEPDTVKPTDVQAAITSGKLSLILPPFTVASVQVPLRK